MPRDSVSRRIVKYTSKLQKALEEAYNRGTDDVTARVRIELIIKPKTKEELEAFASRSTKYRKAKAQEKDIPQEKKPYVFDPMKAGWNGK